METLYQQRMSHKVRSILTCWRREGGDSVSVTYVCLTEFEVYSLSAGKRWAVITSSVSHEFRTELTLTISAETLRDLPFAMTTNIPLDFLNREWEYGTRTGRVSKACLRQRDRYYVL